MTEQYIEIFFPLTWNWNQIAPWLDKRFNYAKGYYIEFQGHVQWMEPITTIEKLAEQILRTEIEISNLATYRELSRNKYIAEQAKLDELALIAVRNLTKLKQELKDYNESKHTTNPPNSFGA